MDLERMADRVRRVDDAMSKVRGRVKESRGLVTVETDAYGTITDLRIAADAMKSDPVRLAAVISCCHRQAREEAEADAARLLGLMSDGVRPDAPKLPADQQAASPAG